MHLTIGVHSFYSKLKEAKYDNKTSNAAINILQRCYNKSDERQLDNNGENLKKWIHALGDVANPRYLRPKLHCSNGL